MSEFAKVARVGSTQILTSARLVEYDAEVGEDIGPNRLINEYTTAVTTLEEFCFARMIAVDWSSLRVSQVATRFHVYVDRVA